MIYAYRRYNYCLLMSTDLVYFCVSTKHENTMRKIDLTATPKAFTPPNPIATMQPTHCMCMRGC